RFPVIEARREAKHRRIGEDVIKEREAVLRRAAVKRQVDKGGAESVRESDRIGISENDNPQLFAWKKIDVSGGAEVERTGVIQVQTSVVIITNIPAQAVEGRHAGERVVAGEHVRSSSFR